MNQKFLIHFNQRLNKMEEDLNPKERDEFFEDIDALGLDEEDN